MGKFVVHFSNTSESEPVNFVDLCSAINFGNKDPRGRNFVVIYFIGDTTRVVFNSKGFQSA